MPGQGHDRRHRPTGVTYNRNPHSATGTATGVAGADLSASLNLSGTTHTDAGTYNGDTWTFAGGTNYNDASGTVANSIGKADATVTVNGYTGPYDAAFHGAFGSASGVGGENAGTLNLGATFKDVPGGTAHWVFTGNGNYKDQSGDVAIVITKATASITVTPYSVIYDGKAHTATGTATGVDGADLSAALNLSGTTHTNAGIYNGDAWSFAGGTNYNDAGGKVDDSIAPANVVIVGTSGNDDIEVLLGSPSASDVSVKIGGMLAGIFPRASITDSVQVDAQGGSADKLTITGGNGAGTFAIGSGNVTFSTASLSALTINYVNTETVNLQGGSKNDTFQFQPGGSVSGSIERQGRQRQARLLAAEYTHPDQSDGRGFRRQCRHRPRHRHRLQRHRIRHRQLGERHAGRPQHDQQDQHHRQQCGQRWQQLHCSSRSRT